MILNLINLNLEIVGIAIQNVSIAFANVSGLISFTSCRKHKFDLFGSEKYELF